MTDIVAVLVIPAEGDPGGLLAPGRCSEYPPARVVRGAGRLEPLSPWYPDVASIYGWDDAALPLWWEGALVPEGLDRAQRVLAVALGVAGIGATQAGEDLAHVIAIASRVARAGLARVVRLARVDGRLVEVSPPASVVRPDRP